MSGQTHNAYRTGDSISVYIVDGRKRGKFAQEVALGMIKSGERLVKQSEQHPVYQYTVERTMGDQDMRSWMADTVTYCLDEALARFHAGGRNQGLTPSATRVLIATSEGIPQFLRTMLAARYSELYEGVRGCSCGEADYGAPGHEGHQDEDRCPESEDGRHQVTSGSCDLCGQKNFN